MTDDTRLIAAGHSFLESPRWWHGDLYVSDFYLRQVLRFPGGRGPADVVCEVPGQPSGLALAPNGELLIVSMLDRTLLRCSEGSLSVVADLRDCVAGPPNDMVGDGRGRVWIGNFGDDTPGDGDLRPTTIVTVGPDAAPTVAADDVNFPNGMVLTNGGSTLLVAETFAGRITAFDVRPNGTLTRRRTWANFGSGDVWNVQEAIKSQPLLPDGIALDAEGALWVADAKGAGVVRVAEGGAVLDRVETGHLAVYAAALGGDTGHELFLCCAAPLGTEDPAHTRHAELRVTTVPVPGAAA